MQRVDWQDGEGDAHTLQRDAQGRRAHVLVDGGGARWWLDHGEMQPHPADGPSRLTLEEAKAQAEQALCRDIAVIRGQCGQCLQTQCPGGECGLPDLSKPHPRQTFVRHLASTAPPRTLPHPIEHPSRAGEHHGAHLEDQVPEICGVAEPPDDVQERATVETPKNGPQRDAAGWPGLGTRAPIPPRQTLVRRLANTAPAQVQAELLARADGVDSYHEAVRALAEAEEVTPELLEPLQRDAATRARELGDAALEVRQDLLLEQGVAKAVLDHHQAQADAARKRFKALEASVERIEEEVLRVVCERAGAGDTRTLTLTTAKVAIWKNAPSVALDGDLDARLLPERFQRVTVEADKTAIRDALKAGERVPGCSLVQRDRVEVR